ncbi:MAG: hypothetical protein RR284_08805 [Ruthenibacterium sp.]
MQGIFHAKRLHVRKNAQPIHWHLWALTGCYCAGLVLGAYFYMQSTQIGTQTYLTYYVQELLKTYRSAAFLPVAALVFLSCVTLQGILLFFSLSCIGAPVIFCVPIFKGISAGCLCAALVSLQGFRGAMAHLLLFWLPELLQISILLLFSDIALRTSLCLFSCNLCNKNSGNGTFTKISLCLRMFLLTALAYLVCAVAAGVLSCVFAPVFL